MNRKTLLILILLCLVAASLPGQSNRTRITEMLDSLGRRPEYRAVAPFRLTRLNAEGGIYRVYVSENFKSVPFRPALADSLERLVGTIIAASYPDYRVEIYADKENIRDLIPNFYRLPAQHDPSRMAVSSSAPQPFVTNLSQPYSAENGLKDRNIALWQSHGWYYDQSRDRWSWQRARMFTTVEDKFTLSFVIPYLVPMLERAGANVFMPRERDMQVHEVIVDNDTSDRSSVYTEKGTAFSTGHGAGFARRREVYTGMQNPFAEGTYRTLRTSPDGNASVTWTPDIPADGWYWVSVAYRTDEHSVADARYTVRHTGGETRFSVDQRRGGGTWIYLGQFYFRKGLNPETGSVTLTNISRSGGIVTADAVRFGGGMGNVARRPAADDELARAKAKRPDSNPKLLSPFAKEEYMTSGRARFWEGARYWMQWAGVPDSVYNFTCGLDDYTDDYAARGPWVNWLNGGSANAPDSAGLAIPIDLALAFHSDAGVHPDTVIGTLSIYSLTQDSKTKVRHYPDGQSRIAARDLADIVQTAVCEDISRAYNTDWTRRWMWDKSYSETRRPDVPAMILELLSHQNYTDMQYGLDPRFKFLVSRAVYKGILRFISSRYGLPYTVQPLPVESFAAELCGDSVRLRWLPTPDTLEQTAAPDSYIIYTRTDGGWDNGQAVSGTTVTLPVERNVLTSYKIVAVNSGGASLDSEVLSVCRSSSSDECVLVINGFNRVSAPEGMEADSLAGFPEWGEQGVPDRWDIQYCGAQYEFDISKKWLSDDNPGLGASDGNYETMYVAGNTHDYPALHGRAIATAGLSFVSCNVRALEDSLISMDGYRVADLILGKQRSTPAMGKGSRCGFKTFSVHLQNILSDHTARGGALLVSGAYVASDLWQGLESTVADRRFAEDVLHIRLGSERGARRGDVVTVYNPVHGFFGEYRYATERNDTVYHVESADALEPADGASVCMRYKENGKGAAVVYDGKCRTVVCGFPIETVGPESERTELMRQMMEFLCGEKTEEQVAFNF